MNDDLIYKLADTFKTDMFHVGSDIRGLIPSHQFKIGEWVAKGDITIIVDENTKHLVSALARIYGNLWAYFMATQEGTWMLFFDGSVAKLHPGNEKSFGLGNARNSLKKLRPALTRVFHMAHTPHGESAKWEPMDLAVTDSL
jgi:hypothetical protein